MRLALTSKEFIINNTEANINTIIESMREAKEIGAETIIFGEAFLQGFDSIKGIYDYDKGIATSIYSEPINRICKESRKLNLDVMFGYFEKDRERISSSFIIIERGELIYNYKRLTGGWKKSSITDKHYYKGQVVEVFEYRHKRCMIALSNDILELDSLYKCNEEIIFCPAYIESTLEDKSKIEEYITKSKEFNCDMILVNSINKDKSLGGAYYIKNGEVIDFIEPGNNGIYLITCD